MRQYDLGDHDDQAKYGECDQHIESGLDEERRRGREVVDHDAHILQALDRHALG